MFAIIFANVTTQAVSSSHRDKVAGDQCLVTGLPVDPNRIRYTS